MTLKKLLVLFLVIISIASCEENQEGFTYSSEGLAARERAKEAYLESLRRDVVFSGDSLTRGVTGITSVQMELVENSYPQILMETDIFDNSRYLIKGSEKMSWINTSEPGLTTEVLLKTLYRRISVMRPKIVVLTIGGNDLLNQLNSKNLNLDSIEGRKSFEQWLLTNNETSKNATEVVQALTKQNIRVVFGLIRPGGMFTEMFEAEGYPEISNAMLLWYTKINDSLKSLNNDKLFLVEDVMAGVWGEHISQDGVHPTQEGYYLMAQNFNLSFKNALKNL